MSDIPQSKLELKEHLAEQIQFLITSCDSFDNGFEGEVKRLAVTIRILVHNTAQSHSLLKQLNRLNGGFISTALPYSSAYGTPFFGLNWVKLDPRKITDYFAMLDDSPSLRWLPFSDWWNETILVDLYGNAFTRRTLVLAVANRDGGAHVDPKLNDAYTSLSRGNSLGVFNGQGEQRTPILKPERVAIRQIAHEMLRTLIPDYRKRPKEQDPMKFNMVPFKGTIVPEIRPSKQEISRNASCPCGRSLKFKQCHGRKW